jgi:quinone-modifying oxidoreductase subunit QmoB
MEKVGVFLCTGCDIGKAIKLDGLQAICEEAGASSFTTHECLCSPDAVGCIRKAIDDGQVDSVLIAACSQRAMPEAFKFDPRKVAVERAPLREQVAWTHPHGEEDTQLLAEDLLRMWVTRVQKEQLPERLEEQTERTVMVVGGGVAGLSAARAVAGLGHPVVVVEKEQRLGGHLAGSRDVVPERPPYDRVQPNEIGKLIDEVQHDARIQVLKGATIQRTAGQPGQFQVELRTGSGGHSLRVGAIVQATGARPYDASRLGHLGYGVSDDVITSHEFEAMLAEGRLERPSDGEQPERVVFVQCAGSRDPQHLPYCSSECCATTLKQVAVIGRDFPDVQSMVVYRDLRAPGQLEHFYKGVQDQSQAMLTRGDVDRVQSNGNGGLSVHVTGSLLGEEVSLEADLVVLAVGMVPNAADGEAIRALRDAQARIDKHESDKQVQDAQKIVDELEQHKGTEILNLEYRQGPDLPALRYGFPDSHFICFPYETRRTGIYAAGTLRAPMDAAQAAEDGWGAALKAVQCIESNARGETVHPRSGDPAIASFFLQRCTQCKRCTEDCPFGALNEDVKGTPEYNVLRCRRCGTCLGACPERIVSFPEYSVDAVAGMIKAVEVPEEDEEKPRIIAFVCENDALAALDEAAARRAQYNPWVRIIPVRCLGAVNVVWIADSLSSGIDGVMLIGCKSGDDYQCHYVRGSELAQYRMGNVKETLDRLSLESERVQVIELARDEFERIPRVLDEFAETIDQVGPNPYKGF